MSVRTAKMFTDSRDQFRLGNSAINLLAPYPFFNSQHHGLRGSASPSCVNGDWLCQWERAIFDPATESTPLDRSPKNLLLVIKQATPTAVPNLVQIRPRVASGQMGEI